MSFRSRSAIFQLTLSLFLLPNLVRALCYTPDGGLSDDISCDSTAAASICCQYGYYCTSSHFCLRDTNKNASDLANDNVYIRGTCSDKSWQSTQCGGHCVKNNPNTGEKVQYCGNGKFCCSDSSSCCQGPTDMILNLGEPKIYARAGVPTISSTAASSYTGATSSSTPSNVPITQQVNGKGDRNAVTVGVSVGVSLGVVLITVIIGAMWYIRKLKRVALVTEMDAEARTSRMEMGHKGMPLISEAACPIAELEVDSERRSELQDGRLEGRHAEMPS